MFLLLLLFTKLVIFRNLDEELVKVFKRAFLVKILYSVFYLILIVYYYHYYVDNIWFYNDVLALKADAGVTWWSNLSDVFGFGTKQISATMMVSKLLYIVGYLCFFSFLSFTLLTTYMSFLGSWYIYKALVTRFPELQKQLALPILYLPSVTIWTSGITKDPFAIFGVGIAFYCLEKLLHFKSYRLKYALGLCLSLFILNSVRSYVFLAFIICYILFRVMIHQYTRIASRTLKALLIVPALLVFAGVMAVGYQYLTSNTNSNLARFSIENVLTETQFLQEIYKEGAGSSYDIGISDGTVGSIALMIPKGIVIALFRPFLWEYKGVLALFTAFESFILLIGTLYLLIRYHARFLSLLFSNNLVMFLFVYSSFTCGFIAITITNYGTLSRYKCAGILFYWAALVISKHLLQSPKASPSSSS
ncbi:MAG: hypothetical protein RL660_599 [Bacteroidota bacterium]